MAYGPYISRITLPGSNKPYDIKDAEARELINELASPGVFLGVTTSNISDGSSTNPIIIDGASVTATQGDWCLHEEQRIIDEETITAKIAYIFNNNNQWQEFTDMSNLGGLAYKDSASGIVSDYVTGVTSASFSGTAATLKMKPAGTNAASSVSFAAHTTKPVFGTGTTATVPKKVGTTKYLTKTNAITGLGTASTDTFVKSYPGTTSKMSVTTIRGVSGSTTASKATAGTAKNVATTGTAVTCATGSLGDETTTQGKNTPMWGASVTNEVLSFIFKPINTTSVTPAVSNGTITPYTFADVTVPKAAATETTVATGSLAANATGATVMTGLGSATTASAVTSYSNPTTGSFVSGTSATSATGAIQYVESVTNSGTDAVTFTSDTVNAITALGAGTAAGQTFTGTEGSISYTPAGSVSVTLTKGNKTITVS